MTAPGLACGPRGTELPPNNKSYNESAVPELSGPVDRLVAAPCSGSTGFLVTVRQCRSEGSAAVGPIVAGLRRSRPGPVAVTHPNGNRVAGPSPAPFSCRSVDLVVRFHRFRQERGTTRAIGEFVGCLLVFGLDVPRVSQPSTTSADGNGLTWTGFSRSATSAILVNPRRTHLHASNQLPKLNTRVRFPSSAPL